MTDFHQFPPLPTPALIEHEAGLVGMSAARLCKRAGINPTTFYRWRDGVFSIQIATVQALIDAIVAARETPPPPRARKAQPAAQAAE